MIIHAALIYSTCAENLFVHSLYCKPSALALTHLCVQHMCQCVCWCIAGARCVRKCGHKKQLYMYKMKKKRELRQDVEVVYQLWFKVQLQCKLRLVRQGSLLPLQTLSFTCLLSAFLYIFLSLQLSLSFFSSLGAHLSLCMCSSLSFCHFNFRFIHTGCLLLLPTSFCFLSIKCHLVPVSFYVAYPFISSVI